jgi:hypothetical protein
VEESRQELDDVRRELRRLGYLSDRFDRFLLQDAAKPRPSAWGLVAAALRVGLVAGLALAAVLALALTAVNGNLGASPFDLVPLFLHLLPPAAVTAGGAFLLLSLLLMTVLRLYPVRRIEALCLVAALLAGGAAAAVALDHVRDLAVAGAGLGAVALAALLTAVAVGAVVKVVHAGLLALAIRWTHAPPERRAVPRGVALAAVLLAAVPLVLPAVLAVRPAPQPRPVSLPSAPGERALLVGVDGVTPEEVDYLLANGEMPAAAELLATGGRLLAYRRDAEPPASFWTSVATGLAAPQHGVAAVDSFRPLGMTTPLARSGPLRSWWSGVAVPLGLAEYRPLLANRRSAFTAWELAAHGGAPVVAVNWWATFPAEVLPGLVVAHGAYGLLGDAAAGAVAPASSAAELTALRSSAAAAAEAWAAPLPPAARRFLTEAVLGPDGFYRAAFRAALERRTRAAALYLPGPDIAAQGWRWADVAFSDLLRRELGAADEVLADALAVQDPGVVALVFDPGRRGGTAQVEGRVLLWRRAGCGAGVERTDAGAQALDGLLPEQVAAVLLRGLGLPQSAELPSPPAACPGPPPTARLESFGSRHADARAPRDAAEYLESLRALGYL